MIIINQLLCITHDIYQSLDDGLETRGVFLDISKAFDKVWHKDLLFKLKQNDLSDGLTSNPKLFVDDISLFSVIHNINSTANNLNRDLMKISNWVFQWKMRFNPDPNKQAQEVIFSRKINKIDHPPLYFNQNLVKSSSTHKHLGMVLDSRLDFNLHLKNVQGK